MIETSLVNNLLRTPAARRVGKTVVPEATRVAGDQLIRKGSKIGEAVRKALVPSNERTIAYAQVNTLGKVEDVWLKGHSEQVNEIADKLIAEIGQAQHEVRLQTFVIDFNAASFKKLMAALAEKQRQNPAFKVMINYGGEFRFHLNPKIAVGSLGKAWTSADLKAALHQHGVEAQVASFIRVPNLNVLHSKTVIIDGKIALVGSANLTDTQSKEVVVKVTGPVVEAFLQDFESGFAASAHRFHVTQDGVTELGAKDLWAAPAVDRTVSKGMVPLTFLSKPAGGEYLASDATRGLLAAIGAAESEIKLFSPNFNNPDVWQALVGAADNGVQVKIMLPKDFNNARAAVDGGNNYQFLTRDLAQLPPRLRRRIEVRWYSADGVSTGPATNHIKYASIDGSWTYVGSQNFDNQAWKKSREAGLGIDDAAHTKALAKVLFDGDWARALPVTVPTMAKNPIRRFFQRWLGI
ncbi:MAG: cls [Cyanobacteria bacterium RYN_339]|nr:cls [Cyanobacteria bacterium RYN_339]